MVSHHLPLIFSPQTVCLWWVTLSLCTADSFSTSFVCKGAGCGKERR